MFEQILQMPEAEAFLSAAMAMVLAIAGLIFGRVTGKTPPPPAMVRLQSAVLSVAMAAVKRRLSAGEAAELLWQHILGDNRGAYDEIRPSAAALGVLLEGRLGEAAAALGIPDAPAVRDGVADHVARIAAAMQSGKR